MADQRVLLMTLAERTSAKGTVYLSGWLGKAQVVAFKSKEPDKYGNEQWEVFVTTPRQREKNRPTRGQSTWDGARDHDPPEGELFGRRPGDDVL